MDIQSDTASRELVAVFDTKDEAEALVVQGLLDSAGIESMLTNPEVPQDILPGVGGMVVRVRPEQAEMARSLIAEQRQGMVSEDFNEADLNENPETSAGLPPQPR